MKIKLYKENPECSKCKVPLGYDSQAIKSTASMMFTWSDNGIYRCPKCFNLYEVEQ